MRHVVLVCAGVCAILAGPDRASAGQGPAVFVERLTEAQVVERARAADPRVRAARARIDAVRAEQDERRRWPNPTATYSREHVASATDLFLVARQEIPLSGRLGRLSQAGRLAVDVADARARFETASLETDARLAFASLLLAQEREAALAVGIRELVAVIELLRVREQAGEGSTYDRLRGERALLDLDADRAAAAADVAEARGRLAAHLGPGVTPEALVADGALMPAPVTSSATALVEQALAARADYRAAAAAIDRFRAEREAAARLRVPTPTLSGGMKRSSAGAATATGFLVSLDVAVPLFNRGQSAVALATAEEARADAAAAALRIGIDAAVRTAHAVLTVLRDRAAGYGQGLAAADRLAAIGRVGYEEGELGILELLDANQQALDARLRALDFAAAARHAAIELDRATGSEMRP
jgi:outer membrane protein TolC